MKANWAEVKRINLYNLEYYQSIGILELDKCVFYLFLTSTIFVALITIYVLAHYYFLKTKE